MIYCVFTDSPHKEIQWLREGFRHCYILRDDESVWTCFQPGRNCLDVSFFLKSDFPKLRDFVMDEDAEIVKCAPIEHKSNYAHSLSIVSCVGACKYFLGIQKPFIFTPYQLYKYLIKESL